LRAYTSLGFRLRLLPEAIRNRALPGSLGGFEFNAERFGVAGE
jgi:hypothetical protein